MDVILAKDVKDLGRKGDVVSVSDGQARNFLLPRGLALPATAEAVRRETERRATEARHAKHVVSGARKVADRVRNQHITIRERANAAGHLYAAVTAHTVAKALSLAGFDVPVSALALKSIKAVGTFPIVARLGANETAEFTLIVQAVP